MSKFTDTITDPQRERQRFVRRIIVLAMVMACIVLVIIARLFYLQIDQHRLYTTLSKQNHLNLIPLEPARGLIFDRNGVLLADNMPVFNLLITPSEVPNLTDTINELRSIIAVSDEDIREFNKQRRMHRKFQPSVLRTQLTDAEIARLAVNRYRLPGVAVQAQMIRHYPYGAAFAQVLGFVGRINAKELAQVDPVNYSATNYIGKTALEKFYENVLHGTVGYQQVETNALGQIVRVLQETPPVSGNNLYLTLDSKLQLAIQQILGNQRAAVVALDPRDGSVLAFVSTPSYDPNLFVAGISQKDFAALQNSPDQPLYNRALRGRYAPGSTVKPYFGLAALNSGAVTPDFTVFDPGWFKLPGSSHVYHGFERKAHGVVDVVKAIIESSDVYFYIAALKMGIDRMADVLHQFGFGEKTGIDLSGEGNGIVPTPQWKQHALHQGWYTGDTVNCGIGQGYTLVTPLQMASAVAAIAMQGQRWQPHVLLRSQLATGQQIAFQSLKLNPVNFPQAVWNLILKGMAGVVDAPDGTAYVYFRGVNYTASGKTGTGQVFSLHGQRYNKSMVPTRLRDNSLFVAFAPNDKPQIALAVIVQNGTTPAAQITREILDYYFDGKLPASSSSSVAQGMQKSA